MLVNIGFLFASNESTYMAMHDVDLLPINDQLSYQFPSEGPFHLSAPNLHPKYHYDKYVGGILLMRNKHFVQVNGFSTKYWGWGLEGLFSSYAIDRVLIVNFAFQMMNFTLALEKQI